MVRGLCWNIVQTRVRGNLTHVVMSLMGIRKRSVHTKYFPFVDIISKKVAYRILTKSVLAWRKLRNMQRRLLLEFECDEVPPDRGKATWKSNKSESWRSRKGWLVLCTFLKPYWKKEKDLLDSRNLSRRLFRISSKNLPRKQDRVIGGMKQGKRVETWF